jgi:DNA-binding SARP family transcriptional activator
VTDEINSSTIRAPKINLLLALLIARADQIVSADQIINELWGDNAPRRVTASLHVYISQLRKFLHRPGRDEGPIVTQPPGYVLRMGSDELDLHVFQRLMDKGRMLAKARRHEEASTVLRSALALRRGRALADLEYGPIVGALVTWVEESHLECVELLVESDLNLSRHRELVGRLYALVAENPLREVFYRQLMLALYRSDRQADALKVYQCARNTLNSELGLEPCRALRDLHQAILAADDHRLLTPGYVELSAVS